MLLNFSWKSDRTIKRIAITDNYFNQLQPEYSTILSRTYPKTKECTKATSNIVHTYDMKPD